MDASRSNSQFLRPGVRLLSSEGFGRIEFALPEGVNVNSGAGAKLLDELPQQTCVTISTVFRMPLGSSGRQFDHTVGSRPWTTAGVCCWRTRARRCVRVRRQPRRHL